MVVNIFWDTEKTKAMIEDNLTIQLRLLRAHRLVQSRRNGRNILYTLGDQCVWDLLNAGESHLQHRISGGDRDS